MKPEVPPLKLWQFREPRRGCQLEECQDALAGNPLFGRFALADGASESFSPAVWADLLVRAFVSHEEAEEFWKSCLSEVQANWYIHVQQSENTQTLPYYLEDRYRRGAFATFLGLTVDLENEVQFDEEGAPVPPFAWQALAIGDSCLFQVRNGHLVEAFPIRESEAFRNAPWLLGSRTPGNMTRERQQTCRGLMSAQDQLWLMTDALAQWFLVEIERGERPWEEFDALLRARIPSRAFRKWVHEQRDNHRLKDDDVSLMIVYPPAIE